MKENVTLRWKKLYKDVMIPERKTQKSAGFDLSSYENALIKPRNVEIIHTGLAVEAVGDDVALFIYARSGLASKHGITLVNSVGVVDADYRGEIMIPLINLSNETFEIEKGMRVAQLVVQPVYFAESIEVASLSQSVRGNNGFGSSGLK